MDSFRYVAPTTFDELFLLLSSHSSEAALLAGGTDLINDIRVGARSPKLVISLGKVRALSAAIEEGSGGALIGALASLSDIARNGFLRRKFPAVAEAANLIGSKQIRNQATMAGNICNASPAADTLPALLLYDAQVNIIGPNGRRSVAIASFVRSPNQTCLAATEIVESIFIPHHAVPSASCYVRFSRREGADLAIVGAAALVSEANAVRLALGAVAPVPFRAREAEAILSQGVQDPANWERGLAAAVAVAEPISDLRASREYRLALIKVLAAEAVSSSLEKMKMWGCS